MWHVSIASPTLPSWAELEALARRELAGVGNPLREWTERGRVAFHLRRRLTLSEQSLTGEVRDIRGTFEAAARLAEIPGLPKDWRE